MGSVVPYGHRNMYYDVEEHISHFVIFKQSVWRHRKRSQNLTKPYRIFIYRHPNHSAASPIEVSLNSFKLLFTLTIMLWPNQDTDSWWTFKVCGMWRWMLRRSDSAFFIKCIQMQAMAIWWVKSALLKSGTASGSFSWYSKSYNFSTGKKLFNCRQIHKYIDK
jgi:hypothetical protein